jgi:hypothetical protein
MRSKTKKSTRNKPTSSVVPAKYRDRYHDGSCGDALADQLHTHVSKADIRSCDCVGVTSGSVPQ